MSYAGINFNKKNLVFDRKQEHVDKAIAFRDKYLKGGGIVEYSYVPDDKYDIDDIYIFIQALQKGVLFVEDVINRIEYWQDKIQTMLNEIGYWNTDLHNQLEWNLGAKFTKSDFERILKNEDKLKNAFFVYKDTPATPPISFHYDDINSIEKILYDLNKMVENVKSNYRECGNFECGGD